MIDSVASFFIELSASAFIAAIVLKTTAVILLGLLIWMFMKNASASARHLVLTCTLFATLLIPAISAIVPPLNVAVSAPAASVEIIDTSANTIPAPSPDQSLLPQAGSADNAAPAVTGSHVKSKSMATYILLAIAAFTAALVTHLGLGIFRLWQISRKAIVIPEHDKWYELIPFESKHRVTLLLSNEMSAPYTWGFLKPVIVLPTSAQEWHRQNKINALLHELSHVDRHDWLFQIIARLVCSLYWYNPLVWIVNRKLVLEAECAADDRVLLAGSRAYDYAEQLVELTKTAHASRGLSVAATTMAAKNLLPDRIHSILNTGVTRMPLHTLSKYAILISIATLSLIIGSMQLVAADDERSFISIDSFTTTPLIVAAASGNHSEVVRLIENGADVNETRRLSRSTGEYQRTALTTAAKAGHADIVATLIDAGARVDRVVHEDATALIEALKGNHVEVAQLLIDNGADVGLTVDGDGSPLIAAAMAGNGNMIDLLLRQGADPNDWVQGDANALFHAASNGNEEIVQLLVDAGVDVNKEMRGDGNALIIATRNDHKDIVKTLLKAGARADASVRGDGNAMITAAKRGDTNTLSMMIATGANVDASIKGDGSPLIIAARNGHQDAVRLLLENGAAIDKVVYGDENALIGAAWAGDLPMVELLLDAGANPNIRAETYNGKYRSALSQAKLAGHNEVVQTLRAAGAKDY